MKVKLSTIYASPLMTAQPGSVIDVSDEEGQGLIAAGVGTDVTPKPAPAPVETAEAPAAPETAVAPAPKRTRR